MLATVAMFSCTKYNNPPEDVQRVAPAGQAERAGNAESDAYILDSSGNPVSSQKIKGS